MEAPTPDSKIHDLRRLIIGVFCVLGIAVAQVGAGQFARDAYVAESVIDNVTVKGFNAPFFITWFNASGLLVCYPIFLLACLISCSRKEPMPVVIRKSQSVFGVGSHARSLQYAAVFSLIAVATNYSFVRALGLSAPSDVTALFASNSAFVFLLSCIVLKASFVSFKIIPVAFAVAGIVLISGADGFQGPTFLGSLLSIGAAFGAAVYTVLFKKVVGSASPDQVCWFLSCTAAFTAFALWPVILIMHYTGHEELISVSEMPWHAMAGSCLLSIVFNFLINFGVAYTYPLFIAFGGIIGVPLNYAVDLARGNRVFDHERDPYKIAGALLILGGFLIILLLPERLDDDLKTRLHRICGRRRETERDEEEHVALRAEKEHSEKPRVSAVRPIQSET